MNGDDSLVATGSQRAEAAVFQVVGATILADFHVTPDYARLADVYASLVAGTQAAVDAKIASVCIGAAAATPSCTDTLGALAKAALQPKVTSFEQAAAVIAAEAASYVAPAGAPCAYCRAVASIVSGTDTVIDDIQSKNYGAAAGATMDVVQEVACDDAKAKRPEVCDDSTKTVYNFLRALAVFSVDSTTSNVPPQAADADFKNAAIQLIESYGGPGVRRRLLWSPLPHSGTWIPEFGLREAWRPGLILASPDAGPGSQLVLYPSMDMLRWRGVLTNRALYFGVHGSFIDALGPFVELALREQGISNKGAGVPFLAAVVPRIDLEFAVPDFSKNLVAGVGGAFRFFRAQGTPAAAQYCVGFSESAACSNGDLWNNIEFSVFVKYVP